MTFPCLPFGNFLWVDQKSIPRPSPLSISPPGHSSSQSSWTVCVCAALKCNMTGPDRSKLVFSFTAQDATLESKRTTTDRYLVDKIKAAQNRKSTTPKSTRLPVHFRVDFYPTDFWLTFRYYALLPSVLLVRYFHKLSAWRCQFAKLCLFSAKVVQKDLFFWLNLATVEGNSSKNVLYSLGRKEMHTTFIWLFKNVPGEHAPDPVAWAKLGLCPYRGTFLSVRKLASTEKHPCIEQMCANTMNSEPFQEWIRLVVFLYKHSALYNILKKAHVQTWQLLKVKGMSAGEEGRGGVQSW